LVGNLINLRRCNLQLKNLEKLILWTRIGPMIIKLVIKWL
jgi:hypothetical protein